jgi:hyperosmotically inducible periplasmic protein
MGSIWRMSSLGAVGLMLALAGPARAQARPWAAVATVEPNAQEASADAQITGVIRAKLDSITALRHARIIVATEMGVVTLSGSVPTAFARDQALDAARGTPGVTLINNVLHLDASSPQAPTRD